MANELSSFRRSDRNRELWRADLLGAPRCCAHDDHSTLNSQQVGTSRRAIGCLDRCLLENLTSAAGTSPAPRQLTPQRDTSCAPADRLPRAGIPSPRPRAGIPRTPPGAHSARLADVAARAADTGPA